MNCCIDVVSLSVQSLSESHLTRLCSFGQGNATPRIRVNLVGVLGSIGSMLAKRDSTEKLLMVSLSNSCIIRSLSLLDPTIFAILIGAVLSGWLMFSRADQCIIGGWCIERSNCAYCAVQGVGDSDLFLGMWHHKCWNRGLRNGPKGQKLS